MIFTNAISLSRTEFTKNRWIQLFLLIFFGVWTSTLIGTSNLSNWILENALVFFFLGFLAITYRRYQFSDLSYLLICIYLCLHVYGSKYTYAENPFGFPAQGGDYLGSQGDIWDAQKDMFLATLGAILATTIVSVVKKVFNIRTEKI